MRNRVLRNLILAGMFAALTAVMAQVSFFLPGVSSVPVTMQVLMVFLTGALLGPVWGPVAIGVYILLGAAGLPVFANGRAGLSVILGPTGGYLLSYPVAIAVIGLLAPPERAPGFLRSATAMLVALVIIYAGGGGWAVLVGGNALGVVMSGWVLPFIPLDLVKVAVAAALTPAVNRALAANGFWRSSAA